ncbi:DNRLRE domain-containing protein [Methylomonas sp. CM2]|uniref:DNRLRE domain-containing protein n=1 Tax=Methylomonas sp. CM2 TaxID=3417647 RepID=UPI003CE9A017
MQCHSTRRRAPPGLAFAVLGFALAGLPVAGVGAATITLGAGKVSTIFENQPTHSIGRGPAVFIGGDADGSPRRGLIDFNIAANLPATAVITGVELTLYLADVAGAGGSEDATPRTIELHRLTGNWAHGPTALGVTQIEGTDQGFPAIPPSPTWLDRRYLQNQPWATPGGDFQPLTSASTLVGQAIGAAYTWASTPELVADVQAMLNAPSTNNGWVLLNAEEWSPDTYRVFYSQAWDDTALRPRLKISYELAAVPLPAAVWLFGVGLLGLAGTLRPSTSSGRTVFKGRVNNSEMKS